MAMAARSASTLFQSLGGVVWALAVAQPQHLRTWLFAALSSAQLQALATPLSNKDKETFMTALFGMAAQGARQKRRACAMVVDVCKICRSQMDSDALLGYLG